MDVFIGKLKHELFEQAIVILNNETESATGNALLFMANAVCFPNKRLSFLKEGHEKKVGNPRGQMICGIKVNFQAFYKQFDDIGLVFPKAFVDLRWRGTLS